MYICAKYADNPTIECYSAKKERNTMKQFGHFDDERKEYVIQSPQTPYPWINYLGTQAFF